MNDVSRLAFNEHETCGVPQAGSPTLAAQISMPTVYVGNPMWAMHSIRESAGVLDHGYMIEVLKLHFQT